MLIGIVGADRVGTQLAKKLIEQNQDVIVLEKDSEKAAAAANTLDGLVVHGDGTNLDDLKKIRYCKS